MNGDIDTGWVEMTIPLEQLDINSITIEEPKKLRLHESGIRYERTLIPFVYTVSVFKFHNLSILTPFMKVHAWDSSTGRLSFELEKNSIAYKKFIEFEQKIIKLLLNHISWLGHTPDNIHEHIQKTLQYTLVDNILTIYLHGQNISTKPMGRVWGWNKGMWIKGATQESFKKGQELRVAVRFQGICFFPNAPTKSRYRIQHQTIGVYYKDS
jgi:hypothetical protein